MYTSDPRQFATHLQEFIEVVTPKCDPHFTPPLCSAHMDSKMRNLVSARATTQVGCVCQNLQ